MPRDVSLRCDASKQKYKETKLQKKENQTKSEIYIRDDSSSDSLTQRLILNLRHPFDQILLSR
jgi:hypothetical protein